MIRPAVSPEAAAIIREAMDTLAGAMDGVHVIGLFKARGALAGADINTMGLVADAAKASIARGMRALEGLAP